MLITIGTYNTKGTFTPKRNINLAHYRCACEEKGVVLSPVGPGRPLKVHKPHMATLGTGHSTKEENYKALLYFYCKEHP